MMFEAFFLPHDKSLMYFDIVSLQCYHSISRIFWWEQISDIIILVLSSRFNIISLSELLDTWMGIV